MDTIKKPLIVVTNDDGYLAPGLKALIDMVKPYGEVLVVAPEKGASGMSHAITISTPMRISLVEKADNLTIYKVNGTPADCVKLALSQLVSRKPDIVVSGINHGTNSSISVIYSGTMGGAIEASLNNIPSIGISLDDHSLKADFKVTVNHCEPIFKEILNNGLPEYTSLNINFPICKEADFKGIKVCRQAKGVWNEEYEKRTDPHGGTYYWLTGYFKSLENGSTDSDIWALENNFASIVPVKSDFTNYDALKEIKHLNYDK